MEIKKFSQELIMWGIKEQAQDLYILPKAAGFQIYFRVGTKKVRFKKLSKNEGEKLIFHFKFIGGMDVGESRKAQVGSVTYQMNGSERRLRLSTVGDFKQRESLVIRFLHYFGESKEVYFFPKQLTIIKEQVQKRGLYLFCGPVGSGKTTLMYKLAKENGPEHQVITVEDPVEIEEELFLQLQTNHKINLTYDALIKVCLRHHPDILIIGEIRDQLTAEAAFRAALTGHTVFATIHARSAQGVYERLRDLGIQQREMSECLKGVVYQKMFSLSTTTEAIQAVLLNYDFSDTEKLSWIQLLRKAWAYGFIDNETFEKERKN